MKSQDEIRRDLDAIRPFAEQFANLQKKSAAENREIIEFYCREFREANQFATGAMHSMLNRRSGVIGKSDERSSRALLLLASFVQGAGACESAIAEGYYLVASVLLRHEMETIAALEELVKGIRAEGAVPNVKHTRWGISKNYGRLSMAAHSTSDKILRETLMVDGSKYGLHEAATPVSVFPVHDAEHSWDLWALHLTMVLQLAGHLNNTFEAMYGEGFTDFEITALTSAYSYLVDAGWLRGQL